MRALSPRLRMMSARMRASGLVILVLVSLLSSALVVGLTHFRGANAAASTLKPVVTSAVQHDTSPALKTLKPAKEALNAKAPTKNGNVVPLHTVQRNALNPNAPSGSSDVQT